MLVATKAEEYNKPLKTIVPDYTLHSEVKFAEMELLLLLGFDLGPVSEHPHEYVLWFVELFVSETHKKPVAQQAWNYLNDYYDSEMGLVCTRESLAVGSVYLACRVLEVPMPVDPVPWWHMLSVSNDELERIGLGLLDL